MSESAPYFDMCLKALKKAETDVEKISALLLITKHLSPNTLTKKQSLELFSQLDLTFIYRLLLFKKHQHQSLPDDVSFFLLQSVAVNIVSSIILLEPTLLDSSFAFKIFSCLAKILDSSKKRLKQEIHLFDDILHCYQCLIEMNDNGQDNVIQTLKKSKSLDALVNLFNRADYGFDKVYPLLSSLATKHSWIIYDKTTYLKFLTNLGYEFYHDKGHRKFHLCSQIVSYLEHNSTGLSLEEEETRNCVCHFSKGLKDIFTSRLNNDLRQLAFKLASTLTQTFKGFDWMIEDNSYPLTFSSSFFCILSRLVCIEVSLILALEEYDLELLGNCFVILEFIINLLYEDEQKNKLSETINPSIFITVLDGLKETILHLIGHLHILSFQWKDLRKNQSIILVVSGIVRILCIWMIEGFELIKKDLEEVLPFILLLLKEENDLQLGHLIIPALHIICQSDEKLRQKIIKENIKDAIDYYSSNQLYKNKIDEICNDLKELLKN